MTPMASAEVFPSRPTDAAEEDAPGRVERFFRRLGVGALIVIGPAAVVYLSFNKGGYFPNTPAFAAIILAQALVLRTLLSEHPFEGYNWAFAVPLIALTAFDALQLASALWSHATARAIDEYVRTLLYLLTFALLGTLPRSWFRLQWLVRALALALTSVCLAGLISRVLSHLWPTTPNFYSQRLSYPLTYWNAMGVVAAMATILLVHLSSSLREPRVVRVLAAMLAPATAATLLLTYSRGAIAVAILGIVVYVVVGRPRGLLSAAVAIIPTAAVGLKSAYDAVLLSGEHPTSAAAVSEGRHVAVILGICMLVAGVLRAALSIQPDRWLARADSSRLLPRRVRKAPRWAQVGAPAAVAVIVLVAVGAPSWVSHQYDRFIGTDKGPQTAHVRERLTDPASNGRKVLWTVAFEQFQAHPVLGQGARTFQFYFNQHRTDTDTVTDAHSLYAQTLGEQGIVGLVLLLVVLLSILVTVARRCRGPERSLYAALFAVLLAWAVHAGVDWDWEMPAVTIVVFIIGGAAMAAARTESRSAHTGTRNATLIAVGFLALAVGPAFVAISYQRLQSAGAALKDGSCAEAKRRALSSISALAVRPEPYEILGYCDLELGFPNEGLSAMKKAETYEPENWNYHFGLAVALAANGLSPVHEARRAVQLDPKEALAFETAQSFERAAPARWQRTAAIVLLHGLQSGVLSVSNL